MKTKLVATFDEEKRLFLEGYDFVLGTDEVGRGPLAGSVVACVCALKIDHKDVLTERLYELPEFKLIRDSKMLSEKQRESLIDFISEHFYVGIGICDHLTIDRLNILEASFLAMKKALTEITKNLKNKKTILLIDGNKIIPNLSFEQRAIVGGDKLVKTIAAASIMAKVTRDKMIYEADKIYPQYGFAKHKGYGTKMHLEALRKYGPSPIHRFSFEPLKSWTKMAKECYYKGVRYRASV